MRTLLIGVVMLASCDKMDAAKCEDVQCLLSSLPPEDLRNAMLYAGPCYRFGYEYCVKVADCEVGSLAPNDCLKHMIDTVCTIPFDPKKMHECAYWSETIDCRAFSEQVYQLPIEEMSCFQIAGGVP